MSTKLNAEELAAKRWPDTQAQKNRWNGTVKYMVNRGRERKAYAAAIREVAQPIADQRDELLRVLDRFVRYTDCHRMNEVEEDIANEARAAIAKCTPKP